MSNTPPKNVIPGLDGKDQSMLPHSIWTSLPFYSTKPQRKNMLNVVVGTWNLAPSCCRNFSGRPSFRKEDHLHVLIKSSSLVLFFSIHEFRASEPYPDKLKLHMFAGWNCNRVWGFLAQIQKNWENSSGKKHTVDGRNPAPTGKYTNLVNHGIKLPTSTGEFTGFLNHQQIVTGCRIKSSQGLTQALPFHSNLAARKGSIKLGKSENQAISLASKIVIPMWFFHVFPVERNFEFSQLKKTPSKNHQKLRIQFGMIISMGF